jgi:hypothetical protein
LADKGTIATAVLDSVVKVQSARRLPS